MGDLLLEATGDPLALLPRSGIGNRNQRPYADQRKTKYASMAALSFDFHRTLDRTAWS